MQETNWAGQQPVFLAGDDEPSARLREFAFAALVREPKPVDPADLIAMSGFEPDAVDAALDRLGAAGRIDRDASGRVLGAAGLTIADGPHGLTMSGHDYRTWCAFDALGIPAALRTDARLATSCAVCDREIEVEVVGGEAPANEPVRLWLSAGGADMRADFCTPTVMLCSLAHAEEWAGRQGQHGTILDLEAAAAEGATSWRSAADVALGLEAWR
ncbi:MAG: organomercurial lyase [Chloroflexota bacterium]